MLRIIRILGAIALTVFSASAIANPIAGDTCGAPDRTATMENADWCAYEPFEDQIDVNGTFQADDIGFLYDPDPWTEVGEITADGTDGYLTATSDAGWGNIPNSGTYAIDASFWDVYEYAVISMHIGGGNGDPDNWAWLMADGTTSGTWSLDYILGGTEAGGGLSNIKLWGAGEPTDMPEPGTLALLGLGLFGMGMIRRRKTS